MEQQSLVTLTLVSDNKFGFSVDRRAQFLVRPVHILSLRELEHSLDGARTEIVLNEAVDEDCGEYVRREMRTLTVLETLEQVLAMIANASPPAP